MNKKGPLVRIAIPLVLLVTPTLPASAARAAQPINSVTMFETGKQPNRDSRRRKRRRLTRTLGNAAHAQCYEEFDTLVQAL